MAGGVEDLNQNDSGPSGGGHRTLVKPRSTLKVELAAGAIDIGQNDNGPQGGGGRGRTLVTQTPKTGTGGGIVGLLSDDRFVGICLIPSFFGHRVFCLD